MRNITKGVNCLIILLTSTQVGWAQETEELRFLNDLEQLRPMTGAAVHRIYVADGIVARLGDYDALLIEQPEVLFHPDSKDKVDEPASLELLANDFATIITAELEGLYEITDKAGPRVLQIKWALTSLQLKYRWSKNPLSYTPVGVVANAIKKARRVDVTKKFALRGVTIELELLDSQTGKRLAASVESRHRQNEPTSWPKLKEMTRLYGQFLDCLLDNTPLLEEHWIDCGAMFRPVEG